MLLCAPSVSAQTSSLLDAVHGGDLGAVRAAIAAGADVNADSEYAGTPLQAAASLGRPDIVELLLRSGADPNAGSPLLIAVERGSLDCVRLLVDAGADPAARTEVGIAGVGSGSVDALGLAHHAFRPRILAYLVDRGLLTATAKDSNVRFRDRPTTEGSTVLGMLQKGQIVTVLGRAALDERIGDRTDYWLRIRLEDGTVAYCFGAFLEVAGFPSSLVPEYFSWVGSRWGPARPEFGYILDVEPERTYRFSFAGEGGGQQSTGAWRITETGLELTHGEALRAELLPAWTRAPTSHWTVQEDPENLFYQYRVTNTEGDTLWSLTYPAQYETRRRFQGRVVLAQSGRGTYALEGARLREQPGFGERTLSLQLWSPEAGSYTQDLVPAGQAVQLLARTEKRETVRGRPDYWYYARISVWDDAYGRDYYGWIWGAELERPKG